MRGMFNDAQLAAAKAEPRFVPLASVPLQDGARAGAALKARGHRRLSGADDLDPARGIGSVLDAPTSTRSGRRRTRPARSSISIRAATPATRGERLRPRQRRRPHRRRHRGGGAAPVQRPRHALPQRQDRFAPMGAAGRALHARAPRSAITRSRRDRAIRPRRTGLLYTDSILRDPRVLRFVVEMIGADRVMMGSDMPFPIGDEDACQDRRRGRAASPAQAASITGAGRREVVPCFE